MYLEMRAKQGQADFIEESEIVRNLALKETTGLCIIAEYCGNYRIQDDTATPLDLDFNVVSFMEDILAMEDIPEKPEENLLPLIEKIFKMEKLVVLDLHPLSNVWKKIIIDAMYKYYLQQKDINKNKKVHYVCILPEGYKAI